jgi:hypothetical protein
MSHKTVPAKSAKTDDSAPSPEVVPAEEAGEPRQPAAAPNLHEAVLRAALDAERAVVESQYSEGLGVKKPAERKTQKKR